MKEFMTLCVMIVLSIGHAAAKSKGTPFIDDSKPFIKIKDINKQVEAWAMCAASYEIMANILSKSTPTGSRRLKELSNGAEIAILMSQVIEGMTPDISPERFDSLWKKAKLSSTELPETRITMLADKLKSATKEGKEAFLNNLSATNAVCVKNLPAQQMYIDKWRLIAKSGLFKIPDN